MDVKPASRTSDCCQLIRYGFLNERIITDALIELRTSSTLRCCSRVTGYPELTAGAPIQLPVCRPRAQKRGRRKTIFVGAADAQLEVVDCDLELQAAARETKRGVTELRRAEMALGVV